MTTDYQNKRTRCTALYILAEGLSGCLAGGISFKYRLAVQNEKDDLAPSLAKKEITLNPLAELSI